MKKAILIVLDSMGVGELPDAEKFGDKGAHTFNHAAAATPGFFVPNLEEFGIGNIPGVVTGMKEKEQPVGAFGKAMEVSVGKDTTTGHWEIAGIETKIPFKTYPDGFPREFIEQFQERIGTEVLGNYPASGTEIIEDLGPEHEKSGKPIVYTSADSVFQIAANTDVIPLEKLYEICEIAREMLVGDWACGRVIARPYIIENGKRKRTSDRHDYSVTPPEDTVLDHIKASGRKVYAVGKIRDIFNGKGITDSVHTKSNMDGVDKTIEAIKMDFDGLIFTNLVEFDSEYGHRRNPVGYGKAIMDFDNRIGEICMEMGDEDLLILCADHGNDPIHSGTDHTREYIPVLAWGKWIEPGTDLGVRKTFADIGATVAEFLDVKSTNLGTSFLSEIKKKAK
ncbi:MAG: phosphopentomutase [Anaerovoracaceae bacterium]|nr:phosphopentomutase [Anaerovoracaceae bacterium]